MGFFPQGEATEILLERHISVKAAAKFSGYNIRYLRRPLRSGSFDGTKIGQLYLAFYGDDLAHRFTKVVRHDRQQWQYLDELVGKVNRHWNRISPN